MKIGVIAGNEKMNLSWKGETQSKWSVGFELYEQCQERQRVAGFDTDLQQARTARK